MSDKIKLPIVGGSYEGPVVTVNPQKSVNMFPVLNGQVEGDKVSGYMRQCPGLKVFASDTPTGEGRGAIRVADKLYVVIKDKFYSISDAGVYTELGSLATSSGFLQMASNGVDIMVIDNQFGYIYNFMTFSTIGDADFPTPSSLTYQDGYYIVSAKGTNQFYISSLLDGTAWDALDFSSADSENDKIVAVVSDHRELWIYCQSRIEVWYNSGNADFPFERIQGVSMTIGLSAVRSPKRCDNTLFWLDDNFLVRRATSQYAPQIVSTRQIEHQISKYTNKDDAIGLSYIYEGNQFYSLIFPTDGKAWEYNAATNFWHERTSKDTRWYANSHCFCYDKNLVLDYQNGKVYELDGETFTDNSEYVKRLRRTIVLNELRKNIRIDTIEIECESGICETGQDPQIMMRYSQDGGKSWSNELWRSIGVIGAYRTRVTWNRLGTGRDWVFEFSMTDDAKFNIIQGMAYGRVLRN